MAATFSVVMATRDRSSLAVAQVQRLRRMASPPDEIVVVDDRSTDDTVQRLGALLEPPVLVAGEAIGVSAARNRGIGRVSNDWTIFIDDDDMPHADWMSRFRCLVAEHPDAVYVSVGLDAGDGTPLPVPTVGAAFHCVGCNFMPGSFAVRTSTLRIIGGFDERIRFGEFTDLALRLFDEAARHGWQTVHEPAPAHRITVRPPAERSSVQADVFISSALVSLEKNRHLWERDPASLALQLEILAVAMIKAERLPEARSRLREALRLAPTPRRAGRLAAAYVTPIRRLIWPS